MNYIGKKLSEEVKMTKPVKAVTFTDVMDMVDGTADIDCSNRGLTSLEGCPEKVKGYFNC